jgi:hypothetical protein
LNQIITEQTKQETYRQNNAPSNANVTIKTGSDTLLGCMGSVTRECARLGDPAHGDIRVVATGATGGTAVWTYKYAYSQRAIEARTNQVNIKVLFLALDPERDKLFLCKLLIFVGIYRIEILLKTRQALGLFSANETIFIFVSIFIRLMIMSSMKP